MANEFPMVSIIIATLNAGKCLKACLTSIENQHYRNWEVILVDNSSTDDTVAIAEMWGKQHMGRLIILRSQHASRGRARNFGFEHAHGDIILTLDADATLPCDYIFRGVERLDHTKLHAIRPSVRETWVTRNYLARAYHYYILLGNSGHDKLLPFVNFTRREVWRQLGGQIDLNFGEDRDFTRRFFDAGFTATLSNDIVLNHHMDWSVRGMIRRIATGAGNRSTQNHAGDTRIAPNRFAEIRVASRSFIRTNPMYWPGIAVLILIRLGFYLASQGR